MKQGTGNSKPGSQKGEPTSHAVSPSAVAQIGIHQVNLRGHSETLYEGKGYKAPAPASTTGHHCGSQGKH